MRPVDAPPFDVTRWQESRSSLLAEAAHRTLEYLRGLEARSVAPSAEAVAALRQLDEPLPQEPSAAEATFRLLDRVGSPATMGSAGGRFFGFVIGAALPVTVAAHWLATGWDQNANMVVLSPAACAIESVAERWLVDLLGLPEQATCSLVTGTTTADMVALVAARRAVLQRHGWDVNEKGLFGAPPIRVIVGDEVHTTMYRALSVVGVGREQIQRVPVDAHGRMRADALPPINGPTIVCVQAGNVNTGAFDPVGRICDLVRPAGAWVHVDGAFGLWAAASRRTRHLIEGFERADSWATDAHKWLNVPYDSGIAFVREAEALQHALSMSASYLIQDGRDPMNTTLEASRRARGVDVWAALRTLGRRGVESLVDQHCLFARRFAEGLRDAGFRVLNDVCLNQVLVSFGDTEVTRRIVRRIQNEGTCWGSGTTWQGHAALRISVSSWCTSEEDVERSLEAIVRVAAAESTG
jgi:glutamate/tyrosine decarboxylase-like PLP-dependent enzyme